MMSAPTEATPVAVRIERRHVVRVAVALNIPYLCFVRLLSVEALVPCSPAMSKQATCVHIKSD
jgi:hypothetical protein